MKRTIRAAAALLCAVFLFCAAAALPAFAEDEVYVMIGSGVNVRSCPGTYTSTVLYCTESDTKALFYGEEADVDGDIWYHVLLPNGIEGYVFNTLASIIKEEPDPTPVPPDDGDTGYTPSTLFEEGKQRIMITDYVNVRQQPTTNSAAIAEAWPCVLQTLGKTVNGSGETWYNVVTPGGLSGYVRSDFTAEYAYTPDAEFEKELLQFPVTFWDGLRYLHTVHPAWRFYADELPITLEYAVNMEVGRKLLSNGYTSLPESWRTDSGVATLEPGYRHASAKALSYFMDPANFICPVSIFMFMQQSYDPATQNAASVKKIVSGSFLDNDEYIGYIIEAANASDVNPDVLAGTILHEQGRSGSALCMGNYPGYEGYYNFFNFSASGTSIAEIITSGLEFAKSKGWDTPRASIIGGAVLYGENYVSTGQYTYYYKDFNVVTQHWYFQYATSIVDQMSNAAQIAATYGEEDTSVSFRIPVYAGSNTVNHDHEAGGFESNPTHHFYKCAICGKLYGEEAHDFTAWQNTSSGGATVDQERHCTVCGRSEKRVVTPGGKVLDLDGDGEITDADALYLMFYTFFPGDYPIDGGCDYNGDGEVTDADAIYLLFYTFFPDDYPIA